MYREEPYTGEELPSKCLCLTYDDGPGKNTFEIAKFLHAHDIKATFFVVGKYAIENEDVLKEVAGLGHLIANHTYEHPDMPYYLSRDGDIQNQILRTDKLIRKYNKKNAIYFRSPYGKWSKEVANDLNSNLLATIDHIGPIHWDIGGIDCYYWKNNITVEETVQKYLEDIQKKDHGIIVMHDEIADMDYLQHKNQTLELTKQLIPILQSKGYEFVRLDEIKSIKEDAAKQLNITLKTVSGKYLYLSENNSITAKPKKNKLFREFGIKDLGFGKFALSASNGLFFSLKQNNGNAVEANEKEIEDYEKFDLIPLNSNRVLLRANNGNYLTIEGSQSRRLTATAEYMRGGEVFIVSLKGVHEKISFSLSKKIKSLKRRFLYIKSKIEQGS